MIHLGRDGFEVLSDKIVLPGGETITLEGNDWKVEGSSRGTNLQGSREQVVSRLESDRVTDLFNRLQTLQIQSETYEKETAFWMNEAMEESERESEVEVME